MKSCSCVTSVTKTSTTDDTDSTGSVLSLSVDIRAVPVSSVVPTSRRHCLVTVTENPRFAIFLDSSKHKSHLLSDLQFVRIGICNLRRYSHSIIQLNDADGKGSLLRELVRRNAHNGERDNLPFITERDRSKLPTLAFGTNKPRREIDVTTLLALAGFKPVSLRNLPMISRGDHFASRI